MKNKRQIKKFFYKWKKLNKIYQKHFSGSHLDFPDIVQKQIILEFYDKNLRLSSCKTYDFDGNIELKSSTDISHGCTPFSLNQNSCSRIIYMHITENIDVYEISQNDVKNINSLITQGKINITLKDYIHKATKTRIF